MHSFHIPVMGLAFTIDSPIKVAQYGISSVIALGDDDLMENMRAFYSNLFDKPYQAISQKVKDYRAFRITEYLNLVQTIVNEKFEKYKQELVASKAALEKYIQMLPQKSDLQKNLQYFLDGGAILKEALKKFIEKNIILGDIDVNIMTKVDKDNYIGNEKLPVEYNDAHAALRGFANSHLRSSVVLSAGMNPRLYSYFEQFEDFFPGENNTLKKKIVLKVSDFRSAIIQGNYLAKKGLWVSEYRIESGLNCGGHAFATDGFLMGPILQEFKEKRDFLIASTQELLTKALAAKNLPIPQNPLPTRITAQGGIGTAEEHDFLLEHYALDSVGWGSPFLLVPEATTVDSDTRKLIAKAKESDFYLSNISPLGVPFNSIRGVSNDYWKQKRIDENKAGSSCPKKYLAFNHTYDTKGLCTASKKYQDIVLAELNEKKEQITNEEYQHQHKKITEKACLCVGLANTSYIEKSLPMKGQQQGVLICPGPNMAYFDKEVSLVQMIQHIYGNESIMSHKERPHFFVKELKMYIDYLKNQIGAAVDFVTAAQTKKWNAFKRNLLDGIDYYQSMFDTIPFFQSMKQEINKQLLLCKKEIETLHIG